MGYPAYAFFSENELRCSCGCQQADMDADFMAKLIALREAAGFPFPLTSAYRCPAHNAKVSKTGPNGPHTTGRAVDIAVDSRTLYWLATHAKRFGMTGLGFSYKPGAKFIHLDDLTPADGFPTRPNAWGY